MSRSSRHTPPLQQNFHDAIESVTRNLSSNWGGLAQQLRVETGRAMAGARLFPMALRRQQQLLTSSFGAPALASISLGGRASSSSNAAANDDAAATSTSGSDATPTTTTSTSGASGSGVLAPIFGDLAMAKDEVKARLAPIPVYTVANPKNEFVLVAGEGSQQLGFFFFRKEDAEAIVAKIREENPRLARDSKVLRVTMDNVYEVFTTPRDQTGLSGIHFRFMPDMDQVRHALRLYREAGAPGSAFVGVPVFQAEGLTVTTQDTQYVPLFLCKEDLDVAVAGAHRQRNAAAIGAARDEAARHERAYQEAMQAAGAAKGRDKVALEAKAAKARSALDAALERAAGAEAAPLPKVEVGSFEEVLTRMSASEGDELAAWSQVMFVAGGLLQSAASTGGDAVMQVAAASATAGGGGGKK